ncbi:hypothetical protein WEU32_06960 [Brevundimonas sp. BH3]|uniref:hypothetical protein n=1 Tax=Brevundimonas sp. BH3 TaxID=3133089 RepID=UPI00324D1AC9
MNIILLQQNLTQSGYPCGAIDGRLGPKTYAALINWIAGRDLGQTATGLGVAMANEFDKHDIKDVLRLSHFLAQSAFETAGFQRFEESGEANYRARGVFQISGAYSYAAYGIRLGVKLTSSPERLIEPSVSMALACMIWSDRKCNALADADDLSAVTKKIAGGTGGLSERQAYLDRIKSLLE